MPRFKDFVPHGVIPAVLLPFHDDLSIDEASYRAHLRDVTSVRGLAAITTNAHSSEVASCTLDEQRRVLEITMDEIGDTTPVVAGVYCEGSLEGQRIARMATEGGASALLVFPSGIYTFGQRPEMAVEHIKRIADATDLPLIIFQYPPSGGQGYPMATLERICDEVPTVRAIKDWSANPQLHDRQIRRLQSRPRPVNVLTTHSAWLMASLSMGANGLLSGAGSVVADLQVALFEAVQAGDLPRARRINDRLYPMQQAFYAPPFLDMHNRMKECLAMLGRLDRAVVRPPLMKLPPAEIERLRAAMREAGIAREGALPMAAE